MSEPLVITSETKIGALLERYPELEDVLIAMAPAFKKLKNPILRRTVARVASLSQAARIANLEPRDLVLTLRKEVGQSTDDLSAEGDPATQPTEAPAWLDRERVETTVDADELLAREENPLPVVTRLAKALAPGTLACVRSSFRPEPLIDSLQQQGFDVFCEAQPGGGFETFVAAAS